MEQNEKELEAIKKELSSILAEKNPLELLQRNLQMTLNVQKGLINQYIEKFITVCNQEQLTNIDIKQKLERLSGMQKALLEKEKSIDELLESDENKTLIGILENDTLSHLLYQLQNGLVTANFLAFGLIAKDYKQIKLNEQMVLPDINEFKAFLNDFLSPFKEKYSNYEMVIKLLNCFENAIIEIYAEKASKTENIINELLIREPLEIGNTYALLTDKITKNNVSKKGKKLISYDNEANTFDLTINNKIRENPAIEIETSLFVNANAINEIITTPFSALDKKIIEAVSNLYYSNAYLKNKKKCFITVNEVLQVMHGEDPNKHINYKEPKIIKVRNALERLFITRMEIKSDKLPQNCVVYINNQPINGTVKRTNALKGDSYEFYSNKKMVLSGYVIEEMPAFMQLAMELKQVTYIPFEKMKISNKNVTFGDLIIRDYLLSEIIKMKGPKKKRNNKIKFETIYESNGLQTPEERAEASNPADLKARIRYEAKKDRDNIYKILDSFIIDNIIKAYNEVKQHGKITGVAIILND